MWREKGLDIFEEQKESLIQKRRSSIVRGLMVSAAMAVEDECGGTRSNTIHPKSNGIMLNSITALQPEEQFPCSNEGSPKVRKPYTISKQRERWTEEEHKKFIEALKLHGRAWRRIEEHVGTKTAVQIRSHAQKFFSKVVRESGSNESSVEPIEIPPPRPKRKPTHPYPRKMIHPVNKDSAISEQPLRSPSSNLSVSEQDNQSPTSVLSAVGSSDSDGTNCSLSPISRVAGMHTVVFRIAEENGSLSPVSMSATDESKVQKLGCAKESAHSEAGQNSSTRSLKLFGRTVLVTESLPSTGPSGLVPSDIKEEKIAQPMPWNFMRADLQSANSKRTWSHLAQEPHGVFYMHFMKENSSIVSTGSGICPPWWISCRDISFPCVPFHMQESVKTNTASNGEEVQDEEVHKEGSSTGSNSGSEDADKNVEGETLSSFPNEEESRPVFELKSNEKSSLFDLRFSPAMSGKGFVPYKKRIVERDSQSSTMLASGEKGEKRILLSL